METDPKQHPGCTQDICHTNSSTATNSNDDNNRFIFPSFRTNVGRASLTYQGMKLWNKGIPKTIKISAKYSSFSKELKQHLLKGNDLILSND